MTPEEAQRLKECISEIAAILYKNTDSSQLTSLEAIETTVRQQMLEQVSHSTQQRLVMRQELPLPQAKQTITEVSVDGGKVRLRGPLGEGS